MNAAAYVRVSTREQGDSGLSLEAQRRRVAQEASARGWTLERVSMDVASGSSLRGRVGLTELLAALDDGQHSALLVTRLDRLTRSLLDFAGIMDRAHKHDWALVIIDSGVDMTTPWGRAMAGMGAVWAQLQRELISENTKEGLAVARERGTFRPGETLRYADDAVIARMVELARKGRSHREIARVLEREGIPGPMADGWHHRTVGRIITREKGKRRA